MNAHYVNWFALAQVMRPLVDLSRRSNEPEWLDGADIDPVELEKVLRDLATFNGAFFGHYPLLRWLGRAVRTTPKEKPLTLVDVGCGYGDLLRAIRRWSRRRGLDLNLVGVDLNPDTIRIARAATNAADRIEFHTANILDLASTTSIDLIVSSLGLITSRIARSLSFCALWSESRSAGGQSAIWSAPASSITLSG
jgi:SAM-dependent methyltransferase